MRVFRIAFSLWYDPLWWRLRKHGSPPAWRRRRYWLARPQAVATDGHALALQFGPLTFRFLLQGRIEGLSREKRGN